MEITVTVMGRVAMDAPFVELSTTTVVLDGAPMACTPAVPPAAAGQDLALRIASPETVNVVLGQWLDPATRPGPSPVTDAQGVVVGEEPAPEPFVRNTYVAWGAGPRQIPFRGGDSIMLRRPGAAVV